MSMVCSKLKAYSSRQTNSQTVTARAMWSMACRFERAFCCAALWVPAHQNAPVAVQPGMSPLDQPAPRFAGMSRRLGAVFAAADMGDEAVVVSDLPGAVVVIALIQVQMLRLRRGGCGA